MKKLIEVEIGGFIVPVIEKKLKSEDGMYCPTKQTIYINKGLTKKMFKVTLMHELLHAIIHLHCEDLIDTIKDMKSGEKIEEHIVVSLALPLLEVFSINSDFTENLIDL